MTTNVLDENPTKQTTTPGMTFIDRTPAKVQKSYPQPQKDKDNTPQISKEDFETISQRGYKILGYLGSGYNRDAFLVSHTMGDVQRFLALKIPKREVDKTSVNTVVIKSRKDLEEAELKALKEIRHPYIAQIFDSFRLPDGRRANLEDYFGETNEDGREMKIEGADLETLVSAVGPITDEKRALNLASKLVEALRYMHEEKGMIHRDIKPSNILVGGNGEVKLTDLQNAAKTREIEENIFPTRGATPYTDPDLINSLFTGEPTKATKQTDRYALGATLIYMLTGKQLPYKVKSSETGKPITVNGETYRLTLIEKENSTTKGITPEVQERSLEELINKVPPRWKPLIKRLMTSDRSKQFYSMEEVQESLEEIKENFWSRLRESAIKGTKIALGAGVGAALFGLAMYGAIHQSKKEPKPTVVELTQRDTFRQFSLENLPELERDYMYQQLQDHFKNAAKRIPKINAQTDNESEKIEFVIKMAKRYANESIGIHPRIAAAMTYAGYLNEGAEKLYEKDGEQRIGIALVPKRFVEMNLEGHSRGHIGKLQGILFGESYLKQCFSPGDTIAEVFAKYYASRTDINSAMFRTHSTRFFPYVAEEEDKIRTLRAGYGAMLPPEKSNIIKDAMAVYLLMDSNGNLNLTNIPKPSVYRQIDFLAIPEPQGISPSPLRGLISRD